MKALPAILGAGAALAAALTASVALSKAPAPAPTPGPALSPVTKTILPGQTYALNVFAVSGLSPADASQKLLANLPSLDLDSRGALLSKQRALLPPESGASPGSVGDQWIIFASTRSPLQLPMPFSGILLESAIPVGPASTGPGIRMLGDPIALLPGRFYRTRIRLSGLTALLGSRSAIGSKAKEIGFTNPSVYMDKSELPASWPANLATDLPSGTTRWAEGFFTAAPRTEPKPDVISEAWEQRS